MRGLHLMRADQSRLIVMKVMAARGVISAVDSESAVAATHTG